ncbi:MAG: hypothetical protein Q9195_004141 [Heterodermia aff. obscurata]
MARQFCIPVTFDVSFGYVSIILSAWPANPCAAEPWWVEALVRNPTVVPYAHGIRRLDTIYLDTTFAAERHNPTFPSKAEGLAELLSKVAHYPPSTIFHFHAWTFGYEEVWIALAIALDSRIHVDAYRSRIYQSLRLRVDDGAKSSKEGKIDILRKPTYDTYLAPEAAALCGHWCGNNDRPGFLTDDQNVRLHSCEAGTDCEALKSPNVVWITPIITHSSDGDDVLEMGAGGGGGDLTQHELEVDDKETAEELLQLCFCALEDISAKNEIKRMISEAFHSPAQRIPLDSISSTFSDPELPLEHFARSLTDAVRIAIRKKEKGGDTKAKSRESPASQRLEAKHDLHTKQPDSHSPPWSKLSIEAKPCMKKRRIDEGSAEKIQKGSPITIPTTTTNSCSCENRLNDIRYTYEDRSTSPSKKLVLMEHSTLDLHPLQLETPQLRASSFTVHNFKKLRKHKPSIQSSPKPWGSKQSQLDNISSRRDSDPCRTASEKKIPRGTQAQPIDLSDISDQEFDSEATTDGESDRPVAHANNMSGGGGEDTQDTLSDSAFESQGQLQPRVDEAPRRSRIRSRKEAYRAAKDLAGLGRGNNFVIVSSNAGRVEEETEL